jgi:spore maturation protein CgeB
VEWLGRLAGLDLALTGPRWRRQARGTPLAPAVLSGGRWGRAAAAVYRSARVGVNVLDPQNLVGHNMRTWELPATGRAAVMTRTPDHERLFANGGAVLVDEPHELRPAVERLLADPEERERIARLGYEAVRDGTYRRRARELVSALEALVPSR